MRIVLCYPVESRHCRQIAAAAPEAQIVDAGQERIAAELFTADIFCGHAKVPVDWDGVVRQGRLKWIQSSAAGMDHCLVPSVVASKIVVTSASGVLANQVAEHAIALITAWLRSLPVFFRAQQAKEFVRRPTRDLHHATVGIVGLGGVGRRLAQLLHPFQTRILATDLFPVDRPEGVEALWPADRLPDLLGESDVVVLSLPLNDSTRGLIDAPCPSENEAHGVVGQHGPRAAGGHGRPCRGLADWVPGGRGDGRYGPRASAASEPVVGDAQRDHHTPCGWAECLADQ